MKIYAPKHDIKETQSVNLKDIPLAFVNTEDSEYSVDIKLNPEFAHDVKNRIRPYDVFMDDNPYFFKENGELLQNVQLKRRNNQYIYEPKSMTEYDLKTESSRFGCSVLIKRAMKYKNSQKYDIKIGVAEESGNLDFSNKLISIFGDANKRGKCPANIMVNGGNTLPQSLIANAMEDNDFFLTHSSDGKNIVKNGSPAALNIDGLLEKHVNLWLSVDSFGQLLQTSNKKKIVPQEFTAAQLYTKKAYDIDPSHTYEFDISREHPYFPKSKYRYFLLHPAVLVMEKIDHGFIIVTPSALLNNFDNMKSNASLIYEVLMNIFMQSYYESAEVTSWITDEPVDYIAGQENKNNARHKVINLSKMIADSQAGNDYSIVKVNSTNQHVIFGGLTADRNLLFYKISSKTDIPKAEDEISYLTTKQTVVNYTPEDIYTSESRAVIDYEITNNNVHVTLHPFHSSKHRICFLKDRTFRLDSKTQSYCLCTQESSPQIQNTIRLVDKRSYDQQPELFGICIATVKVVTKPAVKTYDIRIDGGGLPKDYPDDYNMVDIGHIDGRPYRLGGTMIIRLPKALKEHEDKIRFALKQHIAAGTYPVLIFK